jgi:hypothetical protein
MSELRQKVLSFFATTASPPFQTETNVHHRQTTLPCLREIVRVPAG